MKTLDVPTTSISAVKKSPAKIFEDSRKASNGVYVFNHGDVAGVMLDQGIYESMAKEIEYLREEVVKLRLNHESLERYTDKEVRGEKAEMYLEIDEQDGWE